MFLPFSLSVPLFDSFPFQQVLFSTATQPKFHFNNPSNWSKSMTHFVSKCLREKPSARGDAQTLLQVISFIFGHTKQ